MSTSPTLELAQQLIRRPSVTPADEGCQQLMAKRLEALGFNCESMRFEDVDNLWAVRGDSGPILVFAGHTDVVPSGESTGWEHDPYSALLTDGMLHGRGAADMKGSLAAMVTACEAAIAKANPSLETFRLGFLITSDEEGIAEHGTRRVIDALTERGEKINYCIVGEPSSTAAVGDTIKIGRRGSLSASLTIRGKQGHVAYPHLADNPIHRAMPVLAALSGMTWDSGNDAFPPTTLQISNIASGTGANNVIPGSCKIEFNFRFSTESSHEQLTAKVTELFDAHALDYKIDWHLSGEPFLTLPGLLREATATSIEEITGLITDQSTAGGTSDGRFIAPSGAELVELGPCNATIHQVNERICAADLDTLALIYERLIENLADKAPR